MSAEQWYRVLVTMDDENIAKTCTYYTDDLADARTQGIALATHYTAHYMTVTISPVSRTGAQTASYHIAELPI